MPQCWRSVFGALLGSLLLLPLACRPTGSTRQPTTTPDNNINFHLGNPSGAVEDDSHPENRLLGRKQFVLSYSRSRGGPNWVSWHLQASDFGTAQRTNAFRPDTALPESWRIEPRDYTGSGYDRGHQCPSADRSSTPEDNEATFLMSNMLPQTEDLNQDVWNELEAYCRRLVKGTEPKEAATDLLRLDSDREAGLGRARQRKELYIICGGRGSKERIAQGRVTVPSHCWKIVVILPEGVDDLTRINGSNTEIIAVDIPNQEGIAHRQWEDYITTTREIERQTGYDFLSGLPDPIEAVLETKRYSKAPSIRPIPPPGPPRPARGPAHAAGQVIGNRNTRFYHSPTCSQLPSKANRQGFENVREAAAAGYQPHEACMR